MSNYKEWMKVSPSKAEWQLRMALQQDPETTGVLTEQIIDLGFIDKNDIYFPQFVEGMDLKAWITKPDFLFYMSKTGHFLAVYLDGPSHLTKHNSTRDSRIDKVLIEKGYTVMRIPYNGKKLPQYKIKDFLEQIKFVLAKQETK